MYVAGLDKFAKKSDFTFRCYEYINVIFMIIELISVNLFNFVFQDIV